MNEVRAYFDSRDFDIVDCYGAMSPRNGRKYFRDLKACPYCSNRLDFRKLEGYWTRQARDEYVAGMKELEWAYLVYMLQVATCTETLCGWWALEQISFLAEFGRDEVTVTWGQIKNFDIAPFEEPLSLVREEVRQNSDLLRPAHDKSFERLMTDGLADAMPGAIASHVGTSLNGRSRFYWVQADAPALVQIGVRRNGTVRAGPEAVQGISGILLRDGRFDGVILASGRSTAGWRALARGTKKKSPKQTRVKLRDYDELISRIRAKRDPRDPWKRFILPRS